MLSENLRPLIFKYSQSCFSLNVLPFLPLLTHFLTLFSPFPFCWSILVTWMFPFQKDLCALCIHENYTVSLSLWNKTSTKGTCYWCWNSSGQLINFLILFALFKQFYPWLNKVSPWSYSHVQKVFSGWLLCVRHCSRHWEYRVNETEVSISNLVSSDQVLTVYRST